MRQRLADERGASAVLVGIVLVVLIGMGALAVDVGAMYSTKAQLQNAVDSAAIAAADACARNSDCTTTAGKAQAQLAADHFADGNVGGGAPGITLSYPGTGKVTASAATDLSNHFAPVLAADGSNDTSAVPAHATAQWIAGTATLPFVIGLCEINTSVRPPANVEIVIDNTNGASCGTGGPGGFGWVDNVNCQSSVVVGTWVNTATGSWGSSSSCSDAQLSSYLCKTVLLPVFDTTNGLSGNNLKYHISGFKPFLLTGWAKNPGSRQAFCPSNPSIFGARITAPAASPDGATRWPTHGIQGKFLPAGTSVSGSVQVRLID